MRRRTFVLLTAGQALGLLVGCNGNGTPPEKKEGAKTDAEPAPGTKDAAAKKPPYADVTLCGKCGQVKGSPLCCSNKPDQPRCPKCDLFAGSPGCCRIKKGDPVTLCGKCGQIKGSELCCKPGAEKCSKCGLAKGSPGCCRINKI